MKILFALLLVFSVTACHDREEDHNMPTVNDAPLTDSNAVGNTPDTSTKGVQDSSTSIGYDTSSKIQR